MQMQMLATIYYYRTSVYKACFKKNKKKKAKSFYRDV